MEDIRPCIGCQEGCVNEFVEGGHIQCAVNARCGFEEKYVKPVKVEKPKKVAVVGAGPAGCVYALESAKKGHDVTLFEATGEIGGKLISGGKPMIKFDIKNYVNYLRVQVAKAEKEYTFKAVFNKKVEIEDLKARYDVVVIATGTNDIIPPFPGLDGIPHAMATDALLDSSILDGKEKIAIIGGGVVGTETAYKLAFEDKKQVDVIEMLDDFMVGACTANRGHLLNYMRKNDKVNLHNGCKVLKFENGKVITDQKTSKHLSDPYMCWTPLLPKNTDNPLAKSTGTDAVEKEIDTDFVLIALGYRSENSLYYNALSERVAPEIYNLGDSFKPGKVVDAVRSSYALAMEV